MTASSGGDNPDSEALREVVAKRRTILAALASGPKYKRDLLDDLDTSRSTVDRAVAELLDHALVESVDGAYRATPAGELALERHDAYRSALHDIAANADVLAALPDAAPLDASLLTNATVHRLTEHDRQETLALVGDAIREATSVDAVLPQLSDSRMLDAYRSQAEGADTSARIVLSAPLSATLRERFPGHLGSVAAADGTRIYEGATPPVGLVRTRGEVDAAFVVAYTDDGGIAAVFEHATPDALDRVTDLVDEHVSAATDCTDDLADLRAPSRARETEDRGTRLPRDVEAEGFVELREALFDRRSHAPLLVSWRTGISLSGVRAGHAVSRQREREDGTTVDAAEALTGRLRDGDDTVVVGPPGAGKSTLCKQVAVRWHAAGDPVLYREAGAGEGFESVVALKRHLADREGHVLVVIEDIVDGDARRALQLRREFAGADDVTFLFDAREREWDAYTDHESWTAEAALTEFPVPELSVAACERLLARASDRVGTEFGLDAATLYDDVRASSAGDLGAFYVAVHRVARLADPLGVAGPEPATTLSASAHEAFDRLQSRGQTAIDVGVLVNLLNVCDIPVSPALVYAVGDAEFVDDAVAVLEGVALFPSSATSGLEAEPATVHEVWSYAFLDHAVERLGERAMQEAVGRCLGSGLELAAAPERREALRDRVDAPFPLLDRIGTGPDGWRESFVERVFDGLRNRPRVAPLVGESVLAEVPPKVRPLQRYEWAGNLALDAGNPEQAADLFGRLHEEATGAGNVSYERAALHGLGRAAKQQSRYDDAEDRLAEALALAVRDDDDAAAFEGLLQLGTVAEKRGAFDLAAKRYEAAYAAADALDDEVAAGRALQNLGTAAHNRGEFEAAVDYGRRALDRYERNDERLWEAKVRSNVGNALVRLGDLEDAEAQYHRALDIDTELGRDPGIAGALTNLGDLERLRGNDEPALTYTERAESIYRRIGDDHRRAICLNNVGIVRKNQGDIEGAREAHREAYRIRQAIGNPHELGMSEHNLAVCALEDGDIDAAKAYLRDSMDHLDEAGNTRSVAVTRTVLAAAHRESDDPRAAIDELETAVRELDDCGDTRSLTDALADLVELLIEVGDDAAAQGYARRLRALTRDAEVDGQSAAADD